MKFQISLCQFGLVISLKNMNVRSIWQAENNKAAFFVYFPEKFKKRTPTAKFFWQVYAKIHPQLFKRKVEEQIQKYKKQAKADTKIQITEEFKGLMVNVSAKPDDLVVLSNLIRT